MAKINWDAMLGGIADTGVDAFRAGSAASAARGELNRRRDMDAFNMGAATPIIRGGPVGGLGGMARQQIDASAGLPSEDPSAYDTVGAIGAAPAQEGPQGGMGDGASRASVGNATAQTGSPTDEEAVGFLARLDAGRRKLAIQGAEMADLEKTKHEAGVYIGELGQALMSLRHIKIGVDAAEKIISTRQAQMQQLVGVEDALYKQRQSAPYSEQAEIDKEIHKNRLILDAYKEDILAAQKTRAKAAEGADVAVPEVRRRSKALEMLGAEPDLVENYRKTFMDDGDIGRAGNLILYRFGQGLPGRKPSPATAPRRAQPPARPLR